MTLGDKIKKLFGISVISDEVWDDFLDLLIESDISATYAMKLCEQLKNTVRTKTSDLSVIRTTLASIIREDLLPAALPIEHGKLTVVMLLGVNGVGKTSTAAKLMHYARTKAGVNNVLLAAADTFRAAAIDQLKVHASRLGVKVVAQEHGSDAGAVIYDALDSAIAGKTELLVADTAGRLHNKQNLVRELEKLDRIITSRKEIFAYHKLLVLDATTGTNALRQAELFSEAVAINGIIMTKFDSSAKGGMLATINHDLKLPAYFVCNGEEYTDINPFNPDHYLSGLLGLT
jgi:fused signal recognition particle receptor